MQYPERMGRAVPFVGMPGKRWEMHKFSKVLLAGQEKTSPWAPWISGDAAQEAEPGAAGRSGPERCGSRPARHPPEPRSAPAFLPESSGTSPSFPAEVGLLGTSRCSRSIYQIPPEPPDAPGARGMRSPKPSPLSLCSTPRKSRGAWQWVVPLSFCHRSAFQTFLNIPWFSRLA